MTYAMPCITDSDEFRFEPDNLERSRSVEEYADNLMADCKVFAVAELTNRDNDMYDGDLLPRLMVEIANWTGSIESSHQRMKAMYVLLADELQKVAEKEFA